MVLTEFFLVLLPVIEQFEVLGIKKTKDDFITLSKRFRGCS